MKLILVCGPWSSGTTAVSGVINFLGVKSIAPFFTTNDNKTKNTYESKLFRKLMLSLASEKEIKRIKDKKYIDEAIKEFKINIKNLAIFPENEEKILFLKHPLASLFVKELASNFEVYLIYVLRPMKDIEKTRVRRNWSSEVGVKGAQVIYSNMFNTLINENFPTLMIKYKNLIQNPLAVIKQIVKFTSINPSDDQIKQASAFIKVD